MLFKIGDKVSPIDDDRAPNLVPLSSELMQVLHRTVLACTLPTALAIFRNLFQVLILRDLDDGLLHNLEQLPFSRWEKDIPLNRNGWTCFLMLGGFPKALILPLHPHYHTVLEFLCFPLSIISPALRSLGTCASSSGERPSIGSLSDISRGAVCTAVLSGADAAHLTTGNASTLYQTFAKLGLPPALIEYVAFT